MTETKWLAEGRVIARLIDDSGFTRQEIADALGVSKQIVDNVCAGRQKLKGDRLKLFAYKIGKPADEVRALVVDARKAVEKQTQPPFVQGVAEPVAKYDAMPQDTVTVRGKIIIVPEGKKPVPIYGGVPAGQPGRSFSDAIDVEFVQISSSGTLFGRVVEGGSMEEEFQQRDIVIFEDVPARPNQIVYATKDGEDAFNLLREDKEGNGWLQPLNTDGYDKFPAKGWQIHGPVRARIRYYANGIRETREYPTHMTWRPPIQRSQEN